MPCLKICLYRIFFYPSFVTEDIKLQNNGHPKLILLFTCFFIYQSLRWCSSHTCLWLWIAIFSRASNAHTTVNILVQQVLSNCLALVHLISEQYQYIYCGVCFEVHEKTAIRSQTSFTNQTTGAYSLLSNKYTVAHTLHHTKIGH